MRGSLWSKWDLHLHTPYSIVQEYGGERNWPRFLDELESLDPAFKVLGVNDYWFLDGYERLVKDKAAGRLSNIDCLLPVIEMRLSHLAGANESLKKVNLHVLFDPSVSVETIRNQFVAAISPSLKVEQGDVSAWNGVITREALTELGQSIINSAPEKVRPSYGSPLMTGFSNLTVDLDKVISALSSHYFENKHLLILGRAEWASIKWEAASAATKRDVINRCHIIFTAFEDTSKWASRRQELLDANVLSKIVDCSDAHYWSDSKQPNRIGNCETWMRTIPSFRGLVHAIEEFDSRVYVGQKPPDLLSQEARANRIISTFSAGPISASTGPVPIDYHIELNPRFSVVIGNKGQGKSALLDLIALGGNSTRTADFAFLNPKRFLRSTNHDADGIAVTLTWATGLERTVDIRHGYSASEVEEVEYLPQSLIEKVCSSDPNSATGQDFEAELRRVLFTHIPIEDREEANSFDEILERSLRAVDPQLRSRRAQLRTDVEGYLALLAERSRADLSALRSRERQLTTSLEAAIQERDGAALALDQADVSGDPETMRLREAYDAGRSAFVAAAESMARARSDAAHHAANVRALDGLVGRFEAVTDSVAGINVEFAELVGTETGADPVELISVSIDSDRVERLRGAWVDQRRELEAAIASIDDEQTAIAASLADILLTLEVADADREQKRAHLEAIQRRIDSINGSPAEPQTLRGVRALISRAEALPDLIDRAEDELLHGVSGVHSLIIDRLTVYSDLYRPASEFVQHNPLAAQVGFEFAANLIFAPSWDSLFEGLDARRNAGLISYLEAVRSTVEPYNAESVTEAIRGILVRLRRDGGSADGKERDPAAATKKAISIADYVHRLASLRWIDTQLTITKDGQLLEQLSPGQRGLILLLFYLVVDNSQLPLLLDQPEENLDNEAIKTSLVPAIQFACTRRQIILVTHNANLAIVGDADQILHTTIDAVRRFHIAGGGLADFELGETSIDILEGARPAFSNRQVKYSRVVVDG